MCRKLLCGVQGIYNAPYNLLIYREQPVQRSNVLWQPQVPQSSLRLLVQQKISTLQFRRQQTTA